MSKTVKDMLMKDYAARFEGHSDAMVISIRGMNAIDTNKVRNSLRKKQIKVTVVRNALARKVIAGSGMEGLSAFLEGPSALAYGGQSVVEAAREIVKLVETFPTLELKGAILDGQLFKGKAGVKELSKYPTKDEAIGQAVTLLVGPGRKIMAQLKGPGATVAGIIRSIETKLEKGEAIAKAG
jgi:large subunit ribosomal protein L10